MDHSRVHIASSGMSCGIAELSGWKVDDPDGLLYQLASYLYHPSRGQPVAFFVWSSVMDDYFLVKLFTDNKLGVSHRSYPADNPKTGNNIVIWSMAIQHETFRKWYVEQRVARAKKT